MKKLPARFNPVAFPFVLSIFMSCIVSFVSALRTVGFADFALSKWLAAWGLSWMVAFPAVLLVLPIARKIVATFVEKPSV
jgi:hypothetical protein